MPKIGPDIPNRVLTEVLENYSDANGYKTTIWVTQEGGLQVEVPNPETRQQFVEKHLYEILTYPTVQKAGQAAEVLAKKAKRDNLV